MMGNRLQNEKKFRHWEELPSGGRRYRRYVKGKHEGYVCYIKEVDASEVTKKFCQEVYSQTGELVEIHMKYPEDEGPRRIWRANQ